MATSLAIHVDIHQFGSVACFITLISFMESMEGGSDFASFVMLVTGMGPKDFVGPDQIAHCWSSNLGFQSNIIADRWISLCWHLQI